MRELLSTGVKAIPPLPNVGSSAPELEYRTSSNSLPPPPRTIFPSGWMATANVSAPDGMSVTTFPPDPKVWSRAPFRFKRTNSKLAVPMDFHPAATILPFR